VSSHVDRALGGHGRIRYDRLAIGDLLFFYGFGFVAIYIGHGYVVEAPHTGTVVQIVSLQRTPRLRAHLAGASRIAL
jgi:cell wall-associated NlpC family hydrolase